MEALTALHTRNSVALLQGPGPDKSQLKNIIQAGLRANDHRRLRPWKFLVIEGNAREDLGKLMLEIALLNNPDFSQEEQEKVAAKPLRAPTIVVVVAAIQADSFDKVPEVEQILSAGGAAQLMMAAAHVLNIGAVWRTGNVAYDDRFKVGLGLKKEDHIVGLLYMGTAKSKKPLRPLDVEDFSEYWHR